MDQQDGYMDENIQIYTLPLETDQGNILPSAEEFPIIKNAILKTLPDGTLCIIDDVEDNMLISQAEILYLPPPDNTDKVQDILINTTEHRNVITQGQSPATSLLRCPNCTETFTKIALYKKHVISHRNFKKFKCEQCSACYNVESNLQIHMAVHAVGKPTCPLCHITFQRLASLKSHLILHQVEEVYTCEDCGRELEDEEELFKHSQTHLNKNTTEEDNLICSYCDMKFLEKKLYKHHISQHVKVKKMVLSSRKSRKTKLTKRCPHICSVCLKTFPKLSVLERHLRIHSGEKPFICEFCNKGFSQKEVLYMHINKHKGIKPFECTLCSAKFTQKCNLRNHVQRTHTAPLPGVSMYKCQQCTCMFKKISSLNVHISKMHGADKDSTELSVVMNNLKVLEQQTQGESSSNPVNDIAKTHQKEGENSMGYIRMAETVMDGTIRRYFVLHKTINGLKWYICRYCNKEFKKPSDLIRHTRVHTKERPFCCKHCGASFALKSTLFYHMKTHVANKNCFCCICLKKFSSLRSLNNHLRKHSHKSQYKCLSCNRIFNSMQEAKLHDVEHHQVSDTQLKQPLVETPQGLFPLPKEKPPDSAKRFHCLICSAKFTKLTNMKRHLMLHNNDSRKYKCPQCPKSYCTAHSLKEHSLQHSGIRDYACKICDKAFMTATLLKRHSLVHSMNRPYICPYCKKAFKSVMMCKKHMQVHKKDVTLQRRSDKVAENQLFTEPYCSANIIQNNLENNNDANNGDAIRSSEISVPYKHTTTLLEKDLIRNSNLSETVFINCNDLQLNVNLINQHGYGFNDIPENGLNVHSEALDDKSKSDIKQKHFNLNESNLYNQPELNLLFNLEPNFCTNENLNGVNTIEVPILDVSPPENIAKESQEHDKKNIFCTRCNKSFTNRKNYLKHLPIHRNLKRSLIKHTCTYCSKIFKKPSDLVRHVRTHTGEKPFPCDKCEKRFSLKSTLLSHQRIHNPEIHKQFTCLVCNSLFSTKSSLKVHMTVHTGDKLHKCMFCQEKFRTVAHKKSHEKNCLVNTQKKKSKKKVTNLLAAVALEALNPPEKNLVTEELTSDTNLNNIVLVQDQISLPNESNSIIEPTQLDSIILPQSSSFFLQDNLFSTLIQLDDGTILNVKPLELKDQEQNDNATIQLEHNQHYCDICKKTYASKDVLRKHKKRIHEERKFSCTKCGKSFETDVKLQLHEKVHEGIRPFACMYCSNSFSKENSLTTHLKRIHAGSSALNDILTI